MTDIVESSTWESGVYQLETDDPVLGGAPAFDAGNPITGHANAQAQQLANRTKWLYDNKVGTNDLADTIDPLKGAGLVGYSQGAPTSTPRSALGKLRDIVSVFDFMTSSQINDVRSGVGLIDVSSAIQNALNTGNAIYLPEGTYRVESTIYLLSGTTLIGAGRQKTIIKSEIVGGSLFSTSNPSVAFILMSDMQLKGNGLVGAGGNGHAINLIDPVSGGAWSPQSSTFERIYIVDFRGNDDADRDGIKKIAACGICLYEPLGIVMREVYCSRVGHGFYAHKTQNSRIENCIVTDADKFAVFAYANEQLTVTGCDLINSSDGLVDTGYPEVGLPTGMIGSFKNEGFVFRQNKVKGNRSGKAAIVLYESYGDVIDANWIRGDAQTDIPHKAIYAHRSQGLKVVNNTFSPSQTEFSASRPYETIEFYNELTTRSFSAEISNNVFISTQVHETAYNIKIGGNNTVRSFVVNICNNIFGRSLPNPQATTIQKDIEINNCAIYSSRIVGNVFTAPTNVTKNTCIYATAVTLSGNTIGPNRFEADGGVITTQYDGVFPSVLNAEVLYDAPELIDGTGVTTTVNCQGARLGDFAEASFSTGSLNGLIISAWVSAANTVSVRLQNETGLTVDLGSQNLAVRVRGKLS